MLRLTQRILGSSFNKKKGLLSSAVTAASSPFASSMTAAAAGPARRGRRPASANTGLHNDSVATSTRKRLTEKEDDSDADDATTNVAPALPRERKTTVRHRRDVECTDSVNSVRRHRRVSRESTRTVTTTTGTNSENQTSNNGHGATPSTSAEKTQNRRRWHRRRRSTPPPAFSAARGGRTAAARVEIALPWTRRIHPGVYAGQERLWNELHRLLIAVEMLSYDEISDQCVQLNGFDLLKKMERSPQFLWRQRRAAERRQRQRRQTREQPAAVKKEAMKRKDSGGDGPSPSPPHPFTEEAAPRRPRETIHHV